MTFIDKVSGNRRNNNSNLASRYKLGIICSEIFPGLWLKKEALITGDLAKVLEIVREGIGTPEHQIFVKKLSNI